jgi:superfamily II DNA/RNA helicase
MANLLSQREAPVRPGEGRLPGRREPDPNRPSLAAHLPEPGTAAPDEILSRFLDWVAETGLEPYPAQEEALLELMAGRHVILNTPTGSGKSLVALALHFKALAEGRACFYTSPIKALASEKFFALCADLGPERVGMLTGDASINPAAPIVCCTAEVLSNMALRHGADLDVPYVVMDEFHYYADPERGVAWQVPLLTLPHTRFLLMSATLGDVSAIAERLEEDTGVPVAVVRSAERPVPLEFEYRDTPLHETVEELVASGRAPIYVVNFTRRECAERAQALTSMKLTSKEEKQAIAEAVGAFRFDSPYGKEFRRYVSFGIGVHHAGLLPKYRLLVEQLSQQGLLKVISGTDTLGVGVNIPIRTVLFTRLSKFDGRQVGLLTVRDFKQIAGRAGRKGFDDRGWVVAQAPEHVVENKRLEEKAANHPKKRKKMVKKSPRPGDVPWDEKVFRRLVEQPPEPLRSRFRLTHGMALDLLQRDTTRDDPDSRNFASLRGLIGRSHEDGPTRRALVSQAAQLVRSLYRAGIVGMVRDARGGYLWVTVDPDLQIDFSLHHALSLYLVEVLALLDRDDPEYALDVVTVAEAILEDPTIVLRKLADKEKTRLIAEWKEEGVPYEERMERLKQVAHPQPKADFLYGTFEGFRDRHPWVGVEDVRPKAVGREIYERYMSFADFVREYGLQANEGVLLRYLSQLYKTLDQNVPEAARTPELDDVLAFFRTLVERVDSSLLQEWEGLMDPELEPDLDAARARAAEAARRERPVAVLLRDPGAFAARVRAELHNLVRALARRDWEEAAASVRRVPGAPEPWTAERFEAAMAPYFEEHGELLFGPEARRHVHTRIREQAAEAGGRRRWEVTQVLLDPEGDHLWHVLGTVALDPEDALEGPLVEVLHLGR